MQGFKKAFAEQLRLALPSQEVALERPKDYLKGDLAFPCFKASQSLGMSPHALAALLASKINIDDATIEAIGPYVNLRLLESVRSRATLTGTLGNYALPPREKKNATILVEYSSPNIAKLFTIGHVRSTMLGHALANIYAHEGYDVVRLNHLGDWGTQFGTLLAAYELWAKDDNPNLEKNFPWALEHSSESTTPLHRLLQLYIRFHAEEEKDTSLREVARAWFKKLEKQDSDARRLWKKFRELSLIEFNRIYERLGVTFDSLEYGEAFYEDQIPGVLNALTSQGLLSEGEGGSKIVDLSKEGFEIPCLIQKGDGTSIYASRDLAAALFRKNKWNYERCLYVAGSEQNFHFQQVFAILNKLDPWFENKQTHVPFGLIKLPEGKMSTRKGNVIFLEDVLNEARDRIQKIINTKNPNLADQVATSEMLGTGAVIFVNAFNDRNTSITFDWDKILAFEGDTGPYVQYAHARICSIFRRAGGSWSSWTQPRPEDFGRLHFEAIELPKTLEGLDHASAQNLIFELNGLEPALRASAVSLSPTSLARQLLTISKAFSVFYSDSPILNAEQSEAIKQSRLFVCLATARVINQGLRWLGIHAPSEM